MSNPSDFARSEGDPMHRLADLERAVQDLQTSRVLPSASIGSGGLRVLEDGNIFIDGGDVILSAGGRVISGDPNGARAEITENGYRVFNEDGEVTIDLTVTGNNQLLLRGNGEEDNEILLSQDGRINARILSANEVKLDGQDLGKILDQLAAAATPSTGGKADEDPPPAASAITRRYNAIWSQAYQSNNSKNDFASGLNQGYYSGTNGNQKSLIGFNSSAIQSDHGGRTVTRVRLYLYYSHWYFNGGGTAIIGYHGHSSEPSSFSANTDEVRSANWPKPGGRWVNLDTGFWSNGNRKGVSLGPGPSTSKTYYGTARRHNQSNRPILEIRSTA